MNTKEEILEAFQPYYQETSLTEEINVDLIYKTQKQLGNSNCITTMILRRSARSTLLLMRKRPPQSRRKISNALLPVAKAYNQLSKEDR